MKTFVNGRPIEELSAEEREGLDRRAKARLEEMFASGQAPRVKSDTTFFAGQNRGAGQFDGQAPEIQRAYTEPAKAAGVSITGKTYLSQIAAYPGDPRAWVDSREQIAQVCEERGWRCGGDVTVKGRQEEPKKGPVVAEDIVQEHVEREIQANPEAALKPEETREKVIERIKPRFK